jgi:transposase-like protein
VGRPIPNRLAIPSALTQAIHGREAFPGSGHQTALEEENRRLKRELERTRQERDILKKQEVTSRTASSEVPSRGKLSRRVSGQGPLPDP